MQFFINPFNIIISCNSMLIFHYRYVLLIIYNHDNILKELLDLSEVSSLGSAYAIHTRHGYEYSVQFYPTSSLCLKPTVIVWQEYSLHLVCIITHVAESSGIHINPVMYRLVAQITGKYCIHLPVKSSRESTYAQYLHAVHLKCT